MQFQTTILFALVLAVDATSRRKECSIPASGTNAIDDAPAIRKAFQKCRHNGRVIFEDETYYVNSPLNITGLKNVDVDIHGTLEVSLSWLLLY